MQQFNYKNIKGLDKLSKDQQFFVENYMKLAQQLYKNGDKTLMDLLKKQDNNAEEFLKEVANIMLRYKVKDEKMNIDIMDQRKLTADLDKKINNIFNNEYNEENGMLTGILKEQAKDKYNINSYLLSLGMDFTLEKINKSSLEKILKHTIKGKNYSDRIWDNKNAVSKKVKNEVRKFLTGQTNLNSIEKELRDRFKVNKMCSTRLARNEIARVQNAANEEFFKDNNGEYLLYSATLDGHTCSKCKVYDGKVFKVNDTRPELPLHVNDRCTYILMPSKDYRPSKRIDNTTKENIDYKVYKDWEKGKINALDIKGTVAKAIDKIDKPVYLDELPKGYYSNIMRVVDKAPKDFKKIFLDNKNKMKFLDLEYRGTAHYNTLRKGISINIKADKKNLRGANTTVFHELGHLLDDAFNGISSNKKFNIAIKNDSKNFIKSVKDYYNINSDMELRKAIFNELEDDKLHSISDLLGGATGNKYRGKYLHDTDYWKDEEKLTKEAFAHFFEASIRNDNVKMNNIKEVFPDSYNIFLDMIRRG